MYVKLFPQSVTELKWWQENLSIVFNNTNEDPPNETVYSDAPDNAWRYCFQDTNTGESDHLKKDIII